MPYARSNALKGTSRRPRGSYKRKSVSIAKVKYQAPTARHQKSQILANARLLARHSRMLRQHKVYTDWQFDSPLTPGASGGWAVQRLTDFSSWSSVLRQDPTVIQKSHTFVLRLQNNFRFTLNDADFAAFNLFIVTKRKNAAQYDPFTTAPTLNEDFIESAQMQGFNLRLNPAIYKVHYAKYVTLTKNALFQAAASSAVAGDPYSTWKKSQCTINTKMSVTQPAINTSAPGGSWLDMNFENLPYYHQYFVLSYVSWGGTGTVGPACSMDQLATCINTA